MHSLQCADHTANHAQDVRTHIIETSSKYSNPVYETTRFCVDRVNQNVTDKCPVPVAPCSLNIPFAMCARLFVRARRCVVVAVCYCGRFVRTFVYALGVWDFGRRVRRWAKLKHTRDYQPLCKQIVCVCVCVHIH